MLYALKMFCFWSAADLNSEGINGIGRELFIKRQSGYYVHVQEPIGSTILQEYHINILALEQANVKRKETEKKGECYIILFMIYLYIYRKKNSSTRYDIINESDDPVSIITTMKKVIPIKPSQQKLNKR